MKFQSFQVHGQLQGFIIKDGENIKYLQVIVGEQLYWFKLPKHMRTGLDPQIKPGSWLEIQGTTEVSKSGKLKLLIDQVSLVGAAQHPPERSPQPSAGKVLICQKSSCWQKGGQEIHQALSNCLRDQGLDGQIEIKLTGCLKQCKQGPNLVFMPDKAQYSRVHPTMIHQLAAKHFAKIQ